MIAPNNPPFGQKARHAGLPLSALPPLPKVPSAGRPKSRGQRRPTIRPIKSQPVSIAAESIKRGRPFVAPEGNQLWSYRIAKRVTDILGAVVVLVLLSPIMLTTLVVLCITTRGKPLFFQNRIGYCGRPFPMVKFRTMRLDAAKMQNLVKNEKDGPIFKNRRDPRITRVGRFLRSTSIDETPQLFNILLGHMSLVGPRPPVANEVLQYKAWHRRRLAVRPGLTCLWQVSGRSEIGFEQWMRMDLWYIRRQGIATDLELLVRTPLTVLSRRGAY